MKPETKEKLRREFEIATWRDGNRNNLDRRAVLYDAGPLGYCLLVWFGMAWRNQWFDRARRIKP